MAQGITDSLILSDGSYGVTVEIFYSETYNASSNTSNVALTKLEITHSAYSGFNDWLDGSITINGSTVATFSSHEGTHGVYIGDLDEPHIVTNGLGSVNIAHNADGTKSVSISASIASYRAGGGKRWGTSGSKTITLTTIKRPFTLSISQGTGTSISVKRSGTALSNGATIYYGDSLTISTSANTGYSLASKSHNNGTYTVTGNISVSATASVLSYKLTKSQGTGTTVTVSRTSSPKAGASTGALSNGATIYYSDVLKITISANTGYNLSSQSHTSGSSVTVTGNVTASATATIKTYKITISQGTGTTITVKNGSTAITSGTYVNYGTSLTVTTSANTGYDLASKSHDNGSYTITSATTFSATASVKSFTLSVSAGTGSSITVNRTSSPLKGATTGNLGNGANIYYNDVLKITFGTSTGYNLGTHTVNGSSFTSGKTHKVTAAVTVKSTASKKIYTLSITGDTGVASVTGGGTYEHGATATTVATAKTGYHLVNYAGTTADGGGTNTWTTCSGLKTHTATWTMNANRTVAVSSALDTFTLSITNGDNSSITVKRGSTTLSNGATISYGDVLTISADVSSDYILTSLVVNGSSFTSGGTYTVTDNVAVSSSAKENLVGLIYIDNGSGFEAYEIYIDNGAGWDRYIPYIYNGSEWDMYS